MTNPTNKEEAKDAIRKIMGEARETIAKAERIADKFGVKIDNPLNVIGYGGELTYSPQGSEGDGWSSSDDWDSSTVGGWVSSSSFC